MKIDDCPRILIIDDQFGRSALGPLFKKTVDPGIFSSYVQDRRNLCVTYGLRDSTQKDGGVVDFDRALALATFCPAQHWDVERQEIVDDAWLALEAVRRGWPFSDGRRWALILLDLAFVSGSLDCFGDPQERELFGLEVLLPRLVEKFGSDLPIVILSSTSRELNNPLVRRSGALDFIQRVPGIGDQPERARERLAAVLFSHGLIEDNSGTVVGRSLPVLKMLRQARRAVSAGNHTILLVGETGTGKNLLARYLHQVSSKSDRPYEVFLAGQRSEHLQEDELFGHWKGAFTGAHNVAIGLWERCSGGMILIDEVADLSHDMQQKIMAPIENGIVRRMGHPPTGKSADIDIDVVTILATNRDPERLLDSGALKQDFLNRVNAFVISLPPLRERPDDIPLLVDTLIKDMDRSWSGKLYDETLARLMAHEWREGNVRELRNVLQRALVNNPGQDITASDILFPPPPVATETNSKSASVNMVSSTGCSPSLRWQELASIISSKPEDMTRSECEAVKLRFNGAFAELIAHILSWSLQLNEDATNTARFLSGNKPAEMDATAARQFLKKLLTLDTKKKQIMNSFKQYPESKLPVLEQITGQRKTGEKL